jgi:NitT/TauT family transport system permease protein
VTPRGNSDASLGARASRAASQLAMWALILGAWECAFRVVGWKPWVFPAPSHVLASLGDLLGPQTHYALLSALLVSFTRLLAGFAMSTVIGLSCGVALWRWRWLDRTFGGFLLGLQTLPSVCWVPLSVLLFGLNETGILFVLVMGSAFAMAIGFRDGLRTIPPVYEKAGLMMGARGLKLYSTVIIPASMPGLVSSLRHGFSFAWRSLMGAELIFMVKGQGVGYLLHQGREFSDIAEVMATMTVMVVIGMVLDRTAFAPLERRVHARFGLQTAH